MKHKPVFEWDKLSSPDFANAVRAAGGVCLLPIGCIEKHGDHLPLGTDALCAYRICCLAAEKAPAVVFPYFYFSQINEARHQPGTIALKPELLLPLLENVCDEISRNGLKKILLVNGHGGNNSMLSYFLYTLLAKEKGYTVYSTAWYEGDRNPEFLKSKCDGHAGEVETSCIMHFFPHLAKSSASRGGLPLKRLAHLRENGISTPVDWYSNFPNHLKSDSTPGSADKGEKLVRLRLARLIRQIGIVKKDKVTTALLREFYRKSVQ